MCELDSSMLPPGTPLAAGATGKTKTWGYTWTGTNQACNPRDVYLGPVIVATTGLPTEINFINNLGTVNTGNTATDTKVTFYKYAIDQTLHWADPLGTNPAGGNSGIPEDNACARAGGIPGFGTPLRSELRRAHPGGAATCMAARCRQCWTAARMPGGQAPGPTPTAPPSRPFRATASTRWPAMPRTPRSTATPTARTGPPSGSTTTCSAAPG